VFLPSRLLFLVSHEDVYRFQIENAGYDRLLKTILRAYGGTFEQYAKIQEADIARKLALSFNEVVKQLNFLQEQGLLSYLPQTDQPQLQFVRPRVDLMHLDIDVKYVKLRKKILTDQINAVLAYTASAVCRSKQLLAYFDEPDAEKCWVCDICLAEKKAEESDLLSDKIDFEIITLLQSKPYELLDLVPALKSGTETEILSRISELLDAGKIKTDGKNYYL
jgi:ATP-dependent DNA helicase RecQ